MMLLDPCIKHTAAFGTRCGRVARPTFTRDCFCATAGSGPGPAGSMNSSTGQRIRVSSKVAATRLLLEERTASAEAPVREEISDETLREALNRRVSSLGAEEAARRACNDEDETSERSGLCFLGLVLLNVAWPIPEGCHICCVLGFMHVGARTNFHLNLEGLATLKGGDKPGKAHASHAPAQVFCRGHSGRQQTAAPASDSQAAAAAGREAQRGAGRTAQQQTGSSRGEERVGSAHAHAHRLQRVCEQGGQQQP